MTDISNQLIGTRATYFLQSKGYLTGAHVPARANMILSAFRHLDPKGYEEVERAAKMVGGRQRWVLMRGLCMRHNVNLLPRDSPISGGPVVMEPKNFYTSRSWRYLRMTVLVKRGNRCECCGASPKEGRRIHVDHIRPRSRYPELELDESNLQVLCDDCNLGKSATYTTDWRPEATHGRL
jgi:5-methylcytosine-specific restriction endonuclease McrA